VDPFCTIPCFNNNTFTFPTLPFGLLTPSPTPFLPLKRQLPLALNSSTAPVGDTSFAGWWSWLGFQVKQVMRLRAGGVHV
jgi:hypothetical protein